MKKTAGNAVSFKKGIGTRDGILSNTLRSLYLTNDFDFNVQCLQIFFEIFVFKTKH